MGGRSRDGGISWCGLMAMTSEAGSTQRDTQERLMLRELREARHLSQRTLGAVLGSRQSTISRLERRSDMHLSTLRAYVEALGGVLEIRVRFRDGEMPLLDIAHTGARAVERS
jgi:transcriptional regulator with XRE-family HTH domain